MKKVIKKMVSALLCIILTVGMLAGCGKSDSNAPDEGAKSEGAVLDVWKIIPVIISKIII